jgi:hypothetical protein
MAPLDGIEVTDGDGQDEQPAGLLSLHGTSWMSTDDDDHQELQIGTFCNHFECHLH